MRTVIFSELNQFRFVPLDATYRYNTRHFDVDWFRNQILSWQVKTNYSEKVQRGDRVYLQILSNVTTAPTLSIYSCKQGDALSTVNYVDSTYTIAGNRVYEINLTDVFEALESGKYYLVTTATDADGEQSWITEPIQLADSFPETMLLRYKHYHNKDHVDFERTGITFNMRVESALLDFEPGVNRVGYEAQDGNYSLLSAVTFRGFTWVAGGNGKTIPDYMISKLNHVWALSDVWLDGKKFVAQDGAAFEKSVVDKFPKYAAGIDIREAINNAGVVYTSGGFSVFTIPAYPFVIERYLIGKSVTIGGIPIPTFEFSSEEFAYISDLTALNAWITEQITVTLPGNSLFGELSIESGVVRYTPAPGEDFTLGAATLLTAFVEFTQTVPAGADLSVTAVVMSGAGAPYAVVTGAAVSQSGYLTASVTNVLLQGAPDGTRVFRLFHRNLISFMAITDVGDTTYPGGTLTAVTGTMPSSLTQFWLQECDKLTAFNFYDLITAKATLTTVRILNNDLLADMGGFHTTSVPSFKVLSSVQLNGNALPVAQVNFFFNNMYTAMTDSTLPRADRFGVFGGSINTRQTPAAAPTSTSAIARAALINPPYSWTVLTD